uniref:RING-type domain-containing protein n=1 Tax=Panagrolaimus sp. ES5 TaxID=591445 RepID=A0AC34F5E1_9BILA
MSEIFYVNRRKYLSNERPITYSIHCKDVQRRLQNVFSSRQFYQNKYNFKSLKHCMWILFGFALIGMIFDGHIYVMNAAFGPYHFKTLPEFNLHVQNFQRGTLSWLFRVDYIQVEVGENNIHNPVNKKEEIRRFSNQFSRDRHISTYKKLKEPKIFINLPSRDTIQFSSKFPFDFSKFSKETLNCIINILSTKSDSDSSNVLKISEVEYINDQYAKNIKFFNKVVITKCGILIGYLYSPRYEAAFVKDERYYFYPSDIALDLTKPYFPIYHLYFTFLLCSLALLPLFLQNPHISPYYLYKFAEFRIKILEKYGFWAAPPLEINVNLKVFLKKLNLCGSYDVQLLQLDELIQQSKTKHSRMTIIPANGQNCVVFVAEDLYDSKTIPFVIFLVTEIEMIIFDGIILQVNDKKFIFDWSLIMEENIEAENTEEEERLIAVKETFAEWSHETLMKIDEKYKEQYEELIFEWNITIADLFDEPNWLLLPLINEERNRWHYKYNRLAPSLNMFNHRNSLRAVACFRFLEESNENLFGEEMQQDECVICFEKFELGGKVHPWPCASQVPHIFHFQCMLEWLRRSNNCPFCQQPAIFNI